MQIAMLKTADLPEFPKGFKEIQNWGFVTIGDGEGGILETGEHIVVEASQEDFTHWLDLTLGKGFWRQVDGTPPILQQFERMSFDLPFSPAPEGSV